MHPVLIRLIHMLRSVPKRVLKQQLLVLLLSLLLTALAFFNSVSEKNLVHGSTLKRSPPGTSRKSYTLQVEGLLDHTSYPAQITVSPSRYTKAEAEAAFATVADNAEALTTAPSESFGAVRKDLQLPRSLPDRGIQLRWSFYPDDSEIPDTERQKFLNTYRTLVESDGTVHNDRIPEGESVSGYLSLIMSCYIVPDQQPEYETQRYRSQEYRFYITVLPPVLSEENVRIRNFQGALEAADLRDLGEDSLTLPTEIDGRQLRYSEAVDRSYLFIPLLGVLASAAVLLRQGSEKKRLRQLRENQLLADYSSLLSKLIVYLGAGLTLRNAFETISLHYEKMVTNGLKKPRPLYTELHTLCLQLQRNLPESTVYLNFQKRIDLKPYTRLISLVEQNRKNGSKNLSALLELEMTDAFEQRKHTARRLGEEAGTKLLLPLFLMLSIIMVIVIVPAMTALG